MASAFPTLSPTASTIRKSFFDAANIGTISGNALVAIYPVTERKGRARNFYVTVHQTLFEIHKNQKDAKNKKAAKYLVDFGDVFNVSMQNEPSQIKDDCICIMDPNSTFFIRTTDSEYDLQAWFDWVLERSRECRSTKLLRPVFREEYFEAAWDVQIVRRPKLRRDYSKKQEETQIEDLAEKRPQMLGHRRLCICPSSFLIFSIGCRPSTSIDTPFDKENFVDLSLNVISNYGTQERFFFIRIGRCSEIGSGELWMATEHGSSARIMHERISQINQRESERRRAQGIKINLPTISSSILKSRAHRERSQTQNMHKTGSKHRLKGEGGKTGQQGVDSQANADEANPPKQPLGSSGSLNQNSPFDSRPQSGRIDSVNCLQSIPERLFLTEQTANSSKKSSLVNMLASRIGAKMSAGSTGKPASLKMDQLTAPCSPSAQSTGTSFELTNEGSQNVSLVNLVATSNQCARNSLVNSVFGIRLNRRNSMTGSKSHNPPSMVQKQPAPSFASFSTQPSYDCAEDYMSYDADDRNQCAGHSLKLGSVSSRVSACALTRTGSRKSSSSYSGGPVRQYSTSSAVVVASPDPAHNRVYHHHHHNQLANMPGDYLEMNMDNGGGGICPPKPSIETVFALHEVQSYISNSSESCWTPESSNTNRSGELTTSINAPRAYSLGSRPGNNADDTSGNSRPASSEVGRMPTIIHSQLLHPSVSSSPPNYLKKSILGQTAKNIKSKEATTKNTENKMEKEEDKTIETEGINESELAAEVRKRAHSVGSKSWIKPSLCKYSTAATMQQKKRQDDELGTSDGDNSRRNTYGAKSMGGSSSTCYPHSMEDHVEIDFDRDESPSMDSIPSLNSRNSSLGKQIPLGIRSALDSLAHSRGFGSSNEKCTEKLFQSKGQESIQQIKRKRSVPEMLQCYQPTQQQKLISTAPINQDQTRLLHPNRRSTYDSLMLRLKVGEKSQKRSPPRATQIGPIPSSQSTSSGVSSRSTATESSITTAHGGGSAKEVKETVIIEDDDDYVLLTTPKNEPKNENQQQQQLTLRSIGTILESSSPCSSLSSDGEGKRRGRLTSREKTSPSIDFFDDYSPLIINQKAANQSPVQPTTVADPVRARLSISSSRSPSQSPQPRRKFSTQAQCSPSPVRSYFPIEQQRESRSPTRRKTSAAGFSRMLDAADVDKSPRKFTCPNLATEVHPRPDKTIGKSEKRKQQQECDYALISGQNP